MFEFIKPASDNVFDMINAIYHDKPLILIGAIHLSCSRLFLALYLTLVRSAMSKSARVRNNAAYCKRDSDYDDQEKA